MMRARLVLVASVAAACAGQPAAVADRSSAAAATPVPTPPAGQIVRTHEPGIAGYWAGVLEREGGTAPLALRLVRTDSGFEAVVDAPSSRIGQLALPATVTGTTLALQFGRMPLTLTIDAVAGHMIGHLGDATAQPAIRVELRRATAPTTAPVVAEPVEFSSADGVTLRGTLVLPADAAHAPGIVLVQGRSYGPRLQFLAHAYEFARHGVAAVVFDGRGTGGSGGVAGTHTLANRLDDATAAFDTLAAHPRVDATRIGMLGHSAGGWVAPVVAQSRPIAFLILHSGPAEPLPDQQGHVVVELMKRSGKPFSDADYAAAFDYQRKLVAMAGDGAAWSDIATWAATADGQPWAELVDVPTSEADDQLDYFRRAPHDSAGALQATDVPVLALFGELDWIVPPAINVPLLQRYLTAANNPDFEIVTFPAADHDLMLAARNAAPGVSYRWQASPPDYFETMLGWVAARVSH